MADESFSSALAQGHEHSRGAYLTKWTKSSRKLDEGKEREEGQAHIKTYVVEVEFVATVLKLLHYGSSENCNGKIQQTNFFR